MTSKVAFGADCACSSRPGERYARILRSWLWEDPPAPAAMGAPRTTAASTKSATARPPFPQRALERSPFEGLPQRALDRVAPFDEPFSRIPLALPFSALARAANPIPTPDARDEFPPEPPLFE